MIWLLAIVLAAAMSDAAILSLDKYQFEVDEIVTIYLADPDIYSLSLSINAPSGNSYQYLGDLSSQLVFIPKEEGMYNVVVQKEGYSEMIEFLVGNMPMPPLPQAVPLPDPYISTDKSQYEINEKMTISVNIPNETNLQIVSPASVYKYLGSPESPLEFIPEVAGEYQIQVLDSSWQEIIYNHKVLVGSVEGIRFTIRNSKNSIIEVPIKLAQAVASQDILNLDAYSVAPGKYYVEISPGIADVSSIQFNDLVVDGALDMGMEVVDDVNLSWATVYKSYAIDPTSLNFTNATVFGLATGPQLFKCKNYSFATQECLGQYEKIMDLVPGQPYNFTLTSEDPLFTELSTSVRASCSNSVQTAPGTTSQATASCTNYSLFRFNVPSGAVDGHLEQVHYQVTITITTTGTPVSGSHAGRIDKDTTQSNGNEETIGTSTTTTTTTTVWRNDNLDNTGTKSFDKASCTTWNSGYCDWRTFLSSQFTCSGARKTCATSIQLNWINYTWDYSIDSTLPRIVLGNPANNSYTTATLNTFYYIPSDNLAMDCSLFLNGGLNATNTTIYNGTSNWFSVRNMKDGTYDWYVNCTDSAGNTNISEGKRLYVDTVKPALRFTPPTPSHGRFLSSSLVTINMTHSDSNPDTLRFFINSMVNQTKKPYAAYTNYTFSFKDGSYIYYAVVNDSAGNTNQTPTFNFTVDTRKPSVTLVEPTDEKWVSISDVQFNFTPVDTNLQNCSLWGNFSGNWELNQSKTNVVSGIKNGFVPIHLEDGFYRWNVICYDRAGNYNWSKFNHSVNIDSSTPDVFQEFPPDDYEFNESNVVALYYNVTETIDAMNYCNLTLYTESGIITDGVSQPHINSRLNFTQTLDNGNYNWTVSCTNLAGTTGYSQRLNFSVKAGEDTVGPSVILYEPTDGNWTRLTPIVLKYTPSDSSGLKNCSLYLDGAYNQTKFLPDLYNIEVNNFTFSTMAQKQYSWRVGCFDNSTNSNNGTSQTWYFTVDSSSPSVSLNYPINFFNTSRTSMNFTWTATDNLDGLLDCDLRINGEVNASLNSFSGVPSNKSVSLNSDSYYDWNVTCVDNAFNSFTSSTSRFAHDNTAPLISLGSPANNTLTKIASQTFVYTPSDNFIGLESCSLVVDGSKVRTNYTLLSGQNNFTYTLTSGEHLWTVNCTDRLGNEGTDSSLRIIVDLVPPRTKSFTADPQLLDPGQSTTLTANVTDNVQVSSVLAEITFPSGSKQNYTMSYLSGDLYSLDFSSTAARGSYEVRIISNDSVDNKNTSQTYYFYVRAGVSVNKVYYGRGELVNISGGGFDSNDNISIEVRDNDGNLLSGFPDTVLADTLGNFNYYWTISTAPGTSTGNHTITAYDTFSPAQEGQAYAYLVIKTNAANLYDKNNAGTDVRLQVNESDTSRVSIVTATGQDYLNLSWRSIVPVGQVVSDARFHFQHYETALYNLYLTWRNRTSGLYQRVCVFNYRTGEGFDECALNNYVKTSQDLNNLNLRVTDDNTLGASVGTWTNINFLFMTVKFSTLLTDKQIYEQGQKVQITGSSWPINTPITLNITRSDGSNDIQYTTTDIYGEFNAVYNVSFNAPIGRYVLDVYVTGIPSDKDSEDFNVTLRPVYIKPNKYHFNRGEMLNLSGRGFVPGGLVSISLYDDHSDLVLQDNISIGIGENGTFVWTWQIPDMLNFTLGTYSLNVTDWQYSNLNDSKKLYFILKPDIASRVENSVTSTVTGFVNESDNLTAVLRTYTGVEDYIQFTWSNSTRTNDIITGASLFVEHNESQNFNLAVRWLNGTEWVDVCSIPYRADQNTSLCNLSAYISHVFYANDLTLRITDQNSNTLTDGAIWTSIDIAFLDIDFLPDYSPPHVAILEPLPDEEYNVSQPVLLRVNVTDQVYVDSVLAGIAWPGGSSQFRLYGQQLDLFGSGIYQGLFNLTNYVGLYNVTLYANDTSGNLNDSQMTNFTVNAPDFTTSAPYIFFSNFNPVEGEAVVINATILNIGNLNSSGVVVQFWDGNWTHGTQIGSNITISIPAGQSTMVGTMWIAGIGQHDIFVVIDPPLATNGSFFELNESNNYAYRNISIPSYHLYYGNLSGLIVLDSSQNKSQFQWNITSEANIFAIESGSDVDWQSLQAISRSAAEGFSSNDFNDTDGALGLSGFPDSLNRTYTTNHLPRDTASFNVYSNVIDEVPVVNSTNTSNFVTGMLWDKSDGGIEYDGTQDLIFVTKTNYGQQGKYGVYDYELKVPSNLKDYRLGSNSITLYVELT